MDGKGRRGVIDRECLGASSPETRKPPVKANYFPCRIHFIVLVWFASPILEGWERPPSLPPHPISISRGGEPIHGGGLFLVYHSYFLSLELLDESDDNSIGDYPSKRATTLLFHHPRPRLVILKTMGMNHPVILLGDLGESCCL